MNTKIEAPEPGIYEGVSFDEYRQWDAMNISTLCDGLQSMKHLKLTLDGKPRKDSKAMAFGRALHSRVLEPEIYQKEYQVSERCQAVLKSGARKGDNCGANSTACVDGAWFCGKHHSTELATGNIISQHDSNCIESIAAGIKKTEFSELLDGGQTEISIIFDCSGVRCKARLDHYKESTQTITDLKKVQVSEGDYSSFFWSIKKYHYHIKAAFYCQAIKILTGQEPVFVWLVVEDNEPFDITGFEMSEILQDIGKLEFMRLLGYYKQAIDSGYWTGSCDYLQLMDASQKMKDDHQKGRDLQHEQ